MPHPGYLRRVHRLNQMFGLALDLLFAILIAGAMFFAVKLVFDLFEYLRG